MSKWLLRTAFVALTLLGCAGAGWLIGSWMSAPLAGLLFSAAFGLAAMLLADSMRGERVMAWLRSDAHGPAPGEIGVWGEIGAQIERALRRRERSTLLEQQRLAQLMSAVEASPIGVLLLDRRDQIELCSRVAAMHLGLEAERDLQQPITNLVRAPEFVEHMAAPPSTRSVSFASPTGARVSALVQRYGDGLKLVLTEDITERERAETMRRNFVANVSHEIRTPLTVLAGFVETMSELSLSEAERRRVLALMSSQARRMQTLVADLLTLAQLEGSPPPAPGQWIDVHALLERVQADALALSAGRHELVFSGGDDAQIAGSEAELFSALNNLVVNAVRYTGAGGRIEVRWCWLDGRAGALRVQDSGIGVAREHIAHLTDRFYRVDTSRSRDTGGTGLGLSIVKHVAQRHGGSLDVQSELGKGSTFRLLLPAVRLRHVAHRPAAPAGAESANRA